MSKLDEMRKTQEELRGYMFATEPYFTLDDIDYLLSRIEIAEKALEEISKADDSSLIEHPNEMADIADKALQQLRS